MLGLLWAFRTPIAIGLAVIALLGAWTWHGHVKYEEGYKVGQELYKKEKVAHQKDQDDWAVQVKIWQQQVKAQQEELAQAKKDKEKIVKDNLTQFTELKKQLTTKRNTIETQIVASFRPNDIVTVPAEFVRWHNEAIGTRITEADQGNVQVPKDRSGAFGEVKTFNASYFTQVIVGNINECVDLALRHDKLVDTVKELEASYERTDAGGPKD